MVGADAVRAHLAGIFERWPDMRFTGRRLYVADNVCVSEWTASATTSDGRRIEWDGVDVFPIRDGLIARKDVYSTSHIAALDLTDRPPVQPRQGPRSGPKLVPISTGV